MWGIGVFVVVGGEGVDPVVSLISSDSPTLSKALIFVRMKEMV